VRVGPQGDPSAGGRQGPRGRRRLARPGHAEGSISLEELDERMTPVWAARTDPDLAGNGRWPTFPRLVRFSSTFEARTGNLPKPTGAPTPDRRPPRGVRTDRLAALPRVLPVLLVVGLVLLVTVGHNPAGFVALPLVFFLTARFGPHRRL